MARRRYLIAYDISDPARLRRVIKVMESFGQRLQYSVFLCDLSDVERIAWEIEILTVIRTTEDSVVHIDLGAVGVSAEIGIIGTSRRLPARGPTIV